MPRQQCTATTKTGVRCRAPVTADGLCLSHHPDMRDKMRLGQSRGGSARSNANRAARALPADLKGVGEMLLQAMRDVRDDKLAPNKAQALAALANSYRSVYETGAVAVKLDEIDARLKAAETEGRK